MSENFINDGTYEFINSEDSEALANKVSKTKLTASQTYTFKGVTFTLKKSGRMVIVEGSGTTTGSITNTIDKGEYNLDTIETELRPIEDFTVPFFCNAMSSEIQLQLHLKANGSAYITNHSAVIAAGAFVIFAGAYISAA